jgi:hypothetical protein
MFSWFRVECPVGLDQKTWIEARMRWLALEFGLDRLRQARVVLPTHDYFPDSYDGTPEAVRPMLLRVCGYMGVDPKPIRLAFYSRKTYLRDAAGMQSGAAGTYESDGQLTTIRLDYSKLADPMAVVATLAHELGHVLLLGQGRVSRDAQDHEPLTDLTTIFLGMGLFTANSRVSDRTDHHGTMEQWSISRLGYLTEEMDGYALALFAWIRGEKTPAWLKQLRANPRTYCKRGLRYLLRTGHSSFDPVRPFGIVSSEEVPPE